MGGTGRAFLIAFGIHAACAEGGESGSAPDGGGAPDAANNGVGDFCLEADDCTDGLCLELASSSHLLYLPPV